MLSTGTKIWHLRDESKFYPKVNFNNAIKVIPSKAVVILCFGEIDCREAFLMCVEKAKYEVSMILVTVCDFSSGPVVPGQYKSDYDQ